MIRRPALRALFALVCSLGGGACSKTEPAAATVAAPSASLSATLGAALPAPEPKKPITLTVGHDLWVGYSGVFIASELGFFKEAGLDVKLKPFSNPGDTLPALVAGQLDIGL